MLNLLAASSGHWVDLGIILFLLFFVWDNWGKGLLLNMVEFVLMLSSLLFSLIFYPIIAYLFMMYASFPYGLANSISLFILSIIFQEIFTSLASFFFERTPEKWPFSRIYNLFTFFPLLGQGLTITAFVIILFLSLPFSTALQNAISRSQLAPALYLNLAHWESKTQHLLTSSPVNMLNFLTVHPQLPETVQLHFQINEFTFDQSMEQELFQLITHERQKANVKPLSSNSKLANLAYTYVTELGGKGIFSYTIDGKNSIMRKNEAGIQFITSSEMLALTPNVQLSLTGLLQTPAYREALLSQQLSQIGIAILDAGVYGKIIVLEFTD